MIQKIYEFIWALFATNYWMQSYDDYPYSESFDKWIRDSLKEGHKLEIIDDGFYAKFNGRVLWIENHPYASFRLKELGVNSVQPSRYTKYLMYKQIKAIIKHNRKHAINNWQK